MPAAPPRSGPPPALVVAVAAVVGGWAAARWWPVGSPAVEVPARAARALRALEAPGARARVVRTVDGDTAVLGFRDRAGRGTVVVRYLGVDAPESVHPSKPVGCFGPEAARRNRAWATGRLVRLRFDRERVDRYGRLLAALVPVGSRRSLSLRLVSSGLARTLTIPPNGADAPVLARAQSRARTARRGLWRHCPDRLRSGA